MIIFLFFSWLNLCENNALSISKNDHFQLKHFSNCSPYHCFILLNQERQSLYWERCSSSSATDAKSCSWMSFAWLGAPRHEAWGIAKFISMDINLFVESCFLRMITFYSLPVEFSFQVNQGGLTSESDRFWFVWLHKTRWVIFSSCEDLTCAYMHDVYKREKEGRKILILAKNLHNVSCVGWPDQADSKSSTF